MASLIPNAKSWLDANKNVLLIGDHGVGKTQSIVELAKKEGVNLKYYSCSTLDPYTDLVGVPTVVEDENGKHLENVRPRDLDDAELLFLDELNRADEKVINALLEIIQFQTINGEPLPKLRCVWAAINPPGSVYTVTELDPAVIDRFDVYHQVNPKADSNYLTSAGIRKEVAEVLVTWWRDQSRNRDQREAITPRRLEKIGLLFEQTGQVKEAIPPWFNCDRNKLRELLTNAVARTAKPTTPVVGVSGQSPAIAGAPSREFLYTPKGLSAAEYRVAQYIRNNPTDIATQQAVVGVLEKRHIPTLLKDFGMIVDALSPAIREAFLKGLSAAKIATLESSLPTIERRLPNVYEDAHREIGSRS